MIEERLLSIIEMDTSTVIVSASEVVAKKTRRETKPSERKTMINPVLRRPLAALFVPALTPA